MKNVVILVNPLKLMNSAEFRKEFNVRVKRLNQMLGGARCILAMPNACKGYVRCSEFKEIIDVWFYSNELLEYLLVSESDADMYPFPFQAMVDDVFLDRKGEIIPLKNAGFHMLVNLNSEEQAAFRKQMDTESQCTLSGSAAVGLVACNPLLLFFVREYKEKFLSNCVALKSMYPECSLSIVVPKRLERSAKDLFVGSKVISSVVTYLDYSEEEMCLLAGDSSQISSNVADVLFHYGAQGMKARYLTRAGKKLITHHLSYDDTANAILAGSDSDTD